MYKRRRKKRLTVKKILIFFSLLILLVLFLIKTYFRSPIIVYASEKAQFYASVVINDAVSTRIVPNINTDNIINIQTRSNGTVSGVIVDVHQVNLLIAQMAKEIQTHLINIQNDANHELHHLTIPLGMIFNNPYLSNFGPKLHIKLRMIGSVHTDVVSTAKAYGINNSLIEVSIKTTVKFQVAIPLQTEEITVTTHTPLLIKIIQGSIPNYYFVGGSGVVIPPIGDDKRGEE